VFYIDYSDQQFETFSATPPFVVATTIPKTHIKGAEYESTILVSRFLTVGAALGYLDARVTNNTNSPDSPHFNATASVDFMQPLTSNLQMFLHVDDRFNGALYLSTDNTQPVPSRNYLNSRIGVKKDHYSYALFVRNATNERQSQAPGVELPSGWLRYPNLPRQYGAEVRVSF
jgi:iron complex outermembrane recepter protein